MSEKNDFEKTIANSLSQLSKMQAYEIIHNEEWREKTKGEKIYFLHQMDFSPDDIALIVGTTIGMVRKEISVRKNKS